MAQARVQPGRKPTQPTQTQRKRPPLREDNDEGGSTHLDPEANAPLADPKPGFDPRFLKGLWVRIFAAVSKDLSLVLYPMGLLAVGGLADAYLSVHAWYLALAVGAVKGLGWGYYFGAAAQSVRGGPPRGRVLGMALAAGVLMLSEWSFGLGLLASFLFVFWPILDFLVCEPNPATFLRQTVLLLRKSGLTWYLTQAAVMLTAGMVMLAVDSLGSVLLGPIFGGLLTATLFAPLAHLWVMGRAVWCHRWI